MRRSLTQHLVTALVLLCMQAVATWMTLRRDPVDRFEGAVITGLVWWSIEPPVRRARVPAQRLQAP